jgi:hypothetical protein
LKRTSLAAAAALFAAGLTAVGGGNAWADGTASTWDQLVAEVQAGGRVTLDADITNPADSNLTVIPGVPVTIDLNGYDLIIGGPPGQPAINVGSGASLTIDDTAITEDGGSLEVTGGSLLYDDCCTYTAGAGIGGSPGESGGSIAIMGGSVLATGGYGSAGIGGSYYQWEPDGCVSGPLQSVTVSGGHVTARGGGDAAGIGGGCRGAGGSVSVSGGTVTAFGGGGGAGIGGGYAGPGGSLSVSGGSATAYGGAGDRGGGAGVGGGYRRPGGSVTVEAGGSLTATGGAGAGAIGPGEDGIGAEANFGSLSNAGTLTLPPAATMTVPSGSTVSNTGTVNLYGTLNLLGTLTGAGTIHNLGRILGEVPGGGLGPPGTAEYVDVHNYDLNFDLNGASGSPPDAFRVYAGTLGASGKSLPAGPTPEPGYHFAGWFTAATGGIQILPNINLRNRLGDGPLSATLYAHIEQNPAPTVTRMSVHSGLTSGNTTVQIDGSGFTDATDVAFGSVAAASFDVVSDTRIRAVTPPHPAGTVHVRVTTPVATSAAVSADQFTFYTPTVPDAPTVTSSTPSPPPPPTVPGAPVVTSSIAVSKRTAKISFSAPLNGGSPITSYDVSCKSRKGGKPGSASGPASPIKVKKLSPGKKYKCKARARNAVGPGPWSASGKRFTLPNRLVAPLRLW